MTDHRPRPLTQEELDALRQDMVESAEWARAELRRRHEHRGALPHTPPSPPGSSEVGPEQPNPIA